MVFGKDREVFVLYHHQKATVTVEHVVILVKNPVRTIRFPLNLVVPVQMLISLQISIVTNSSV